MIKHNLLLLVLILFCGQEAISQNQDRDFGKPLVVLTESNPWLMVIGSDVPTLALYDSGRVIYKVTTDNRSFYVTTKLDMMQTQAFISSLKLNDELSAIDNEIMASNGSDQPTNTLVLNFKELKIKNVYGNLRTDQNAIANTPQAFLDTYNTIINFKGENATTWIPEYIEVLLTDYSHSPRTPLPWPEEWPNLESKSTVERNDSLYSLYLPKANYEDYLALLNQLKEKQGVQINGTIFSVSTRFPFPNLR